MVLSAFSVSNSSETDVSSLYVYIYGTFLVLFWIHIDINTGERVGVDKANLEGLHLIKKGEKRERSVCCTHVKENGLWGIFSLSPKIMHSDNFEI